MLLDPAPWGCGSCVPPFRSGWGPDAGRGGPVYPSLYKATAYSPPAALSTAPPKGRRSSSFCMASGDHRPQMDGSQATQSQCQRQRPGSGLLSPPGQWYMCVLAAREMCRLLGQLRMQGPARPRAVELRHHPGCSTGAGCLTLLLGCPPGPLHHAPFSGSV